MFYWMYPNSDVKAPVAIWLNGGPGASSTFSNFLMTGPMRVDHYGDG
jgi:carboxypeptidase C (cathepsin A)